MSTSTEFARFMADHATAEARQGLLAELGVNPAPARLAGWARSRGYELTEADFQPRPISDAELDQVAGGARPPPPHILLFMG
ncbi:MULTISPECIES: hypothetical protein [Roseomonadaceae]|uniref:Nif11-like leader peptide family natural product n=1 Tax=Falsiroseomonas oleicola TaxID=2801474 RepID=A0ABS6HEQ9_9PROT|nr:hypothetical protein [Roseomonas oleicola]MBU8546869.1 hypothetical protein [Roseomonas oleicola]